MSGASKAAAMAPAVPAPTITRMSLRRSRNARPSLEASAPRGLGVARLHPHRGTEPVRQQGLRHDDQAVAPRDPAAMEGVGLDRVDDAAGRR